MFRKIATFLATLLVVDSKLLAKLKTQSKCSADLQSNNTYGHCTPCAVKCDKESKNLGDDFSIVDATNTHFTSKLQPYISKIDSLQKQATTCSTSTTNLKA